MNDFKNDHQQPKKLVGYSNYSVSFSVLAYYIPAKQYTVIQWVEGNSFSVVPSRLVQLRCEEGWGGSDSEDWRREF